MLQYSIIYLPTKIAIKFQSSRHEAYRATKVNIYCNYFYYKSKRYITNNILKISKLYLGQIFDGSIYFVAAPRMQFAQRCVDAAEVGCTQEVNVSLAYQENEALLGKYRVHLQPVSFSRLCIVVYEIKCLLLMQATNTSLRFSGIPASSMFPCPVCDVKLNSAEQRRAHCRGKNHIKREEARKKAEELGTNFDSTPDHCDVCNVPLTSKMTAIDHFKGKMHQKKVKAVEEQRQGFKNYCEICDVRLQSLKVSEAHFNGKQHHKRERKTSCGKGQGKRSMLDRKSRPSRPRTGDFSTNQDVFCPSLKETPTNSSSWESLNCDNDSEPKDPLSEFRTFRKYSKATLKLSSNLFQTNPCFTPVFLKKDTGFQRKCFTCYIDPFSTKIFTFVSHAFPRMISSFFSEATH